MADKGQRTAKLGALRRTVKQQDSTIRNLIAQRTALRLLIQQKDQAYAKLQHKLRAARFFGGLLLRFKAWRRRRR